jgi:peptidoglycan hydrolase-like protein with peptidoglycan-binding domain
MTVNAVRSNSAAPSSRSGLVRYGMRGPEVLRLQQMIRSAGIDVGPLDGIFGPKTLAGVKAYQASRGLTVDGIAGPQTFGALNRNAGATQTQGPGGGDSFSLGPGRRVAAYINGQPQTITVQPVGNGQYMRADAADGFLRMQAAARAAGINLTATSGFRTMEQQQELYRRYLNGTGNLAARPGYSNHQGGISMDIGGIGGYGTRAYNWLRDNAARFGFRNDVGGEPWHWTFRG